MLLLKKVLFVKALKYLYIGAKKISICGMNIFKILTQIFVKLKKMEKNWGWLGGGGG
jgi:hypothetical protein